MAQGPAPQATTIMPSEQAVARVHARLARGPGVPWLHAEAARRMAQRLVVIRQQPQAWIEWAAYLGGGAQALRQAYPRARRIVVEPDEALLTRSRAAAARPWWALGRRAEVWSPELAAARPGPPVHLLWSNMALHRAADPVRVLVAWHELLAIGGFLMFSTLGPGSLSLLREIYLDAGWGEPSAPFVDMHDLGDMLVATGFADPVMDQETITLQWSSPSAALAELRELGGNTHPLRHAGLRTPRWRERLLAALASRTDAQGRVALQFELVYGHAFRVAPPPARGIPVTVSVDALRATLPARRSPKGVA